MIKSNSRGTVSELIVMGIVPSKFLPARVDWSRKFIYYVSSFKYLNYFYPYLGKMNPF